MDNIAVFVGQHLDLYVLDAAEHLFHIKRGHAESLLAPLLNEADGTFQFVSVLGYHHTDTTTAARWLYNNRITDAFSHFLHFHKRGVGRAGEGLIGTWNYRYIEHTHQLPCPVFGLDLVHNLAGWADEDDALFLAHLGELGVLRQKAVTGMKGFRFAPDGDFQYLFRIQIALGGLRRADGIGFVSQLDVERVGVDVRIDHNRAYTHLLARPDNPDGNFTTVGYHDFAKHHFILTFKCPCAPIVAVPT